VSVLLDGGVVHDQPGPDVQIPGQWTLNPHFITGNQEKNFYNPTYFLYKIIVLFLS
jgi:hypothetical protein